MADARPRKPASDRRKQQNRLAQKGYRERQKQRMQALERLVTAQDHSVVESFLNGLTSTMNPPESGVATPATRHAQSTSPSCTTSSSSRTEGLVASGAGETRELPVHGNAGSMIQADSMRTPDVGLRKRFYDQLMQEINSVDETVYNRIVSGEISISQIFQSGLRHTLAQSPQNSLSNDTLFIDGPNPALRTDRILVPENRMQVHAHALPDVYANHLRLKQFTTISALRASAESLGLTFATLSSPETESPFYRGPFSKDTAKMVLDKENFDGVAPHLRPTIAQMRHRHHPYLDVLPFPTLRERIIEACSLDSPILDEEDLCDDLKKNGLICWGSYLGEGNTATGFGAPWDYRSWEAQPWFLKKWWFFVGGSQGELFQQTRWWHEMRGDRLVAPW